MVLYFLKLGAIGFGGPVALVGYMHRDLVEERKWITEEDYKEGLALAQLAPGPLAAQLAIYLGYVHYRVSGATLAGLAFVLPSFLMVLGLGYAYVEAGGLPWMQALFYGIGPAVIGIIAVSSYKLSKKSLGKDYMLWSIAMVLAVATFLTEREILWLILAGGVLVWLYRAPPRLRKPAAAKLYLPVLLQASVSVLMDGKLAQIWWFFLKAGAFV
ncbi:MAG TPA: chromate efflux transporter, partial [Chitinophagaceae bacterium]|nr:chromate efflux transporter [Chitinophagaceae bacterium]